MKERKQMTISWNNISLIMIMATLLGLAGCETNKDVERDEDLDLKTAMATMTISPTSAVIRTSDVVDFSVEGGAPPFWWTLADGDIGKLSIHNHRAVYTPLESGGNIVIATDSRGNSTSATIIANP